MKESYMADLDDAEKALFQLISEHSTDLPSPALSALRIAYRELQIEEDFQADKIRRDLRKAG